MEMNYTIPQKLNIHYLAEAFAIVARKSQLFELLYPNTGRKRKVIDSGALSYSTHLTMHFRRVDEDTAAQLID